MLFRMEGYFSVCSHSSSSIPLVTFKSVSSYQPISIIHQRVGFLLFFLHGSLHLSWCGISFWADATRSSRLAISVPSHTIFCPLATPFCLTPPHLPGPWILQAGALSLLCHRGVTSNQGLISFSPLGVTVLQMREIACMVSPTSGGHHLKSRTLLPQSYGNLNTFGNCVHTKSLSTIWKFQTE